MKKTKNLLLVAISSLLSIGLSFAQPVLTGATVNQGTNNQGSIFTYDVTSSLVSELHAFDGAPTGASQYGTLLEATDGLLYGSTYFGGTSGYGVLYSMDPATNIVTKLHDFLGGADGGHSQENLLQVGNEVFGYSIAGGTFGDGTIYKYNIVSGVFSVVHSFNSGVDGNPTWNPLVLGSDGLIYGANRNGGSAGFGTIWSLDPSTSVFSVEYVFSGGALGGIPNNAFLQHSNGLFYGIAQSGGANGFGVLYSFNPLTSTYTAVYDRQAPGIDGSLSYSHMTEASNGLIYGTTDAGGPNGGGAIFKFDPSTNIYNVTFSFNGANGINNYAWLKEASDGFLYASTLGGGANNAGTLYRYDITTDAVTILLDYSGAPGVGGSLFNQFLEVGFLPSSCAPTSITPDVALLSDATGQCSVSPAAPTATNDCGTVVNGTPDVTLPITTIGTTVVTWTYDDGTNTLTQTQNVVVTGADLQTVSPLTQEICINTSADIDLLNSEIGFDYYLRDDATDTIVAGPLAGTGGPLVFNTGSLSANSSYNVIAVSGVTTAEALSFDGVNDYVNTGINIDPATYPNFTFETWIYPTRVNYGTRQAIFSHDDCCYDRGLIIESGTSTWTVSVGGANWQAAPVDVNTWQHIAVVYDDATNSAKFYKNGVEYIFGGTTNFTGSANPMWIGRNPGYNEPFEGSMDDVRTWSTSRTTAEINAQMSNCLSGGETGLVAYYKLDDGTGSSIASDETAASNDGILVNMDPATDWILGTQTCASCETEMTPVVDVIIDATNPVAVCQDITIQLDGTGNATIVAADIDGGSTDFCPVTLSIPAGLGSDQFDCTTLGANTVTLTVTDDNGNTATCDATVTVEDIEAPTVTCNNFIAQLDAAGNATITADDIGGLTAADNCGVASVIASTTSFTCANIGANTVAVTVTDVNGNVTTCDATVTVEDNILPNAICQNVTVTLDASGNGSITAADIDNGSNDNCGVASISIDISTFDCTNIGSNTVTLTVTDLNGNVSTCTSNVTVVDNINPIAVCQDITVQLDASGFATIVPADIDNGSNDACGIASTALDITSFNCTNVGTPVTVTLTATDNNSNTSTCNATVTVVDNVAPNAICQDISVDLDATGNVSITAADIDNGSNAACGIAGLAIDISTFDCSNVGPNTVTLTVTDNNGNVSTCNSTVTVNDVTPPTAVCQDFTISLDAVGLAVITPAIIDNGSSDACGIASIMLDNDTFGCGDLGANTVTLTVTDVNGLSSNCTATVTVIDDTDPLVICPGDITLDAIIDNCGRVVNYAVPFIDNCSVSIVQTDGTGYTDGDLFPVGVTPQSYEITDASGNVTLCSFNVTIEDNQIPAITGCPADISVNNDLGTCDAIVSWIQPTASDNCPGVVFTSSHAPGSAFPEGSTVVTYTATDASGNTNTCTFTITVTDNEAPVFAVCAADLNLSTNLGDCFAVIASLGTPTVTDNCTLVSVTSDAPATFPVGTTVVTWTAIDLEGNTSTCVQNVNVTDDEAPSAICQNITVQLDATGNYTMTATEIDGGSTDPCGIALFAASITSFDCSNLGPNTVVLTVTDNNGNTSTCDAVVTVEDNVAPVAVCQDITVQLDANGIATIAAADVDGGSTDACGVASFAIDISSFDCSNIGANAVEMTVTDINGNSSTCNSIVTVEDNVAPTAVCQDITVQLDANGIATIVAADVDGGSADACGILTTTIDNNTFTCANIGSGNSVTLTVTDLYGNSSTCAANVTVEDTVAPLAVCQDITVQLDATGIASISGIDVDGGSTDNCAVASFDVAPNAFTCADLGVNVVTLTVTDVNGNTSTCTANVTVEDNIAPVVICPTDISNFEVVIDYPQYGDEIVWSLVNNLGVTVLSGGPYGFGGTNTSSVSLNSDGPFTFNLTTAGFYNDNIANWSVNCNGTSAAVGTTSNGASTSVPGLALCGGSGIEVSADPGLCTYTQTTTDWDPTGTDNCSVTTNDYVLTGATTGTGNTLNGVTFNQGTTTITWTNTDQSGNTSTPCSIDVTINDTEIPNAICNDLTIQLDNLGTASIVAADLDGGSTDNCGVASVTISQTVFDCSHLGANSVTLTVTDIHGNVATCVAIVTVEDLINPTIACPADILVSNDIGLCGANVIFPDPVVSDNCAGTAVTQFAGIASGDLFPIGTTTNTFVAIDNFGNTDTCSFEVTIVDNELPMVVCNDITVQLDATGNATMTPADIDGGLSTDNCGIDTQILDVSSFDCSAVGPNTVTMTVTDVNGNVETCSSTVTVQDNVAPNAICQDITVQLDATGNASIIAADIDNGSNDACGIATITASPLSFTCANVGANTVTLTVTDVNGNVSTCTSTVTVEDNVPPVAICQDITVQLDAAGNVSITGADIDNGSNAACGIASLVVSPNAFDCSNVGPNTVTLTVTDNNGNTASCTSVVTIEDNVLPNALCQDMVVQLDATGNASITAADIDAGSTDACGVTSLVLDVTDFDCSNVGPNTVTLTVTDVHGNVSTCTSTVTVEDNVDPIITCPADITVSADPGVCDASSVAYGTATATDACGILTIIDDAPATFPLGNTTVTWTATDVNGNTTTCSQVVTVIDSENPVITCPADITVNNDAGECFATGLVLGMATATDNCSPPLNVSIVSDAPSVFPVGNTNVTWTATDDEGNSSTCTQIVTVIDNEAPIVSCPSNVTVDTDANGCFATGVILGTPTASDNCSGIASIVNDAPLAFSLGMTVVTWTVTDDAGNVSTCTQEVTVIDNEAPVIVCPADITLSTDAGTCDGTVATLGTELTFDNCTVASVTNDAASLTFPIGTTIVTWTVTDASGNTSTCTQTITVLDTENPGIICPADVTVSADAASCEATGVALGTPTSNDNCTVASVTNDAPASYPLGTSVVTWTITDDAGNIATCTQNVTVEDNELPMITCPADLTVSTAGGLCDVTGVALGTPVTTDNCSVASVTNNAPATFVLGTTTVTWTVTDGSGNVSTCDQLITVEDNELPTISCPSDIVITADAGQCFSTAVVLGAATGSDNCTVASITSDAPSTFPIGVTTVTWTIVDGSGNSATCEQFVTVTDDELPSIVCPFPITVSADAGTCGASSVALGLPITGDNCLIASVTNDAPAVFPLGTTTVTWTAEDGSGNSVTCTQEVTVEDNELPTIVCPADVVVSSDAGVCTAIVTLVTPLTDDNCSVASVTNDAPVNFPLGNTTVTWTVEDGSGNIATCTQLVTVEDNEAPIIVCPGDLTVDTDPGMCEASAVALGTPFTSDNCSIASVSNDAPAVYQLGSTTVTWTIEDGSGNITTCTQLVTVEDNEAPTIVCPADIIVDNVPGNCGRIVSYNVPTIVDNCNITALTQTDGTGYTSGSWFPIGSTIQEFTVTDETGNVLSCSFLVTVEDNEAPQIVICPSDTVVYSDADRCDMPVFFGTPVASDNCPGVTYASAHISGDVYPLGVTTVNYDAIDVSGNTATCSFTIEVIDTISPVAPELAAIEGGCSVTLPVPSTTDNCGGTLTGTTSTVFPVTASGITTVIWSFDDGNGNITNVPQYISIDGAVNTTVSIVDDLTLMSNNSVPGVTYQWIDCNTGLPIAGETNQTYMAMINGSYAVEVTEPGCTSETSICYDINSVGLEDITFGELILFPNPTETGMFTVRYEGQINSIELFDMIGRIVQVPTDLSTGVVNGSELAKGKYMVRVSTDQGMITKEIIVLNK
ncbi:MAG: HYR domain-containing protein [Crocinitomicaceae bacterium]|nr:HYR domain-containing protein [Crocinitomicaceae bacterium]